jgi:hypothetical protein
MVYEFDDENGSDDDLYRKAQEGKRTKATLILAPVES